MHRPMLVLAVILGLSAGATTGRAQVTNGGVFSDPFSLYYGLYLPRTAALAAQTTSQDVINNAAVSRQEAITAADRPGLYEDIKPFGLEDLDPTLPLGKRYSGRGYERRRPAIFASANGAQGPPQYFNATSNGLGRYYPNLKPGRSANANIATTRGRFGGGRAPSASGYAGGMASFGAGLR